MFDFTCNICNSICAVESRSAIDRENPTCQNCGSTARIRWVVHALSRELFGKSMPLPMFPIKKRLKGMGMSDWPYVSDALAEKFDYANTFYNKEPRFDILSPEVWDDGVFDFIVASEVFEHIPPPIQPAFNNLHRILDQEGFVIFSVPWAPDGHTREHYPDLHDWQLVTLDSGVVLVNRTADGRLQTFENLVFHGGPGLTLEMRLFSRTDLVEHFRAAGFAHVEFSTPEEYPEYGVVGNPWSLGMVARKSIKTREKISL